MTTAPTRSPIDPRSGSNRPRATAPAATRPTLDPIRVLRQKAWLIAGSAVVGLALGGVAHFVCDYVYPLYSDVVLFELVSIPDEVGSVLSKDVRTEEAVERAGQTEASRILSRELLERAVNDRDIEQTKWSEWYRDENGQFVVADAVDDLEDELYAGHVRRTTYFQLGWSTHVASDIPVVLNRIAETYIADNKASDDKRFASNRDAFRTTLADLDKQLLDTGNSLTAFVTKNNMTSTNEDRNEMLVMVEDTSRRVGETLGFLTLATSRKAQTEAKMEGRIEPTPDDIRNAEEDPQIQQASSTVHELRVARETYRRKFGSGHNALRTIEKQTRSAELELDAKLQQILKRNLNADFKTFADQVDSYSGLLEKYEKDLATQGTRLKDFTANLTMVQELKERRERILEARAEQLKVIADLDQLKARADRSAVSIAKDARTPREKSFPRIKVMLPLGCVLTMALVIGLVFLREFLDTRVRYATDLLGIPGLRLLGSVPDLAEDPLGPTKVERVVRDAPKSVLAEVYRQISGQIYKNCVQNGVRTLACMSGLPEAGTTAFVTNLADSIAARGSKVLVIDANFRRSNLAAAMGMDSAAAGREVGLGDVLRGGISLTDATKSAGDHVDILSAGSVENRVFELLTTARMDEVLQEASTRYDLVILDLPPVVAAGDAMAVANKVDGTILVVRAFQEQRGLVNRLAAQLGDVRGQFIGAVLNRPTNTAGGYLRKNYEVMAEYSAKA